MNKEIKILLNIDLTIPFYSYGSKDKDSAAKRAIKHWIKETLETHLSYIPLYAEKDNNGAWIEDSTQKITYSLMDKNIYQKNNIIKEYEDEAYCIYCEKYTLHRYHDS